MLSLNSYCMNIYILLALMAILMFSNYFLAIINFEARKKEYDKHYEIIEKKENPNFKKIEKMRKKPIKLLVAYLFILGISYWVYRLTLHNPNNTIVVGEFDFLKGFMFAVFGYSDLTMLGNLISYKVLDKKPFMIEGKIKYSNAFLSMVGIINPAVLTGVFLLLFVLHPSVLVSGFIAGGLIFVLKNILFMRRFSKMESLKK